MTFRMGSMLPMHPLSSGLFYKSLLSRLLLGSSTCVCAPPCLGPWPSVTSFWYSPPLLQAKGILLSHGGAALFVQDAHKVPGDVLLSNCVKSHPSLAQYI